MSCAEAWPEYKSATWSLLLLDVGLVSNRAINTTNMGEVSRKELDRFNITEFDAFSCPDVSCQVTKYLILTLYPVLILGGLVGNSFALLILQSKTFRGTPVSLLLTSLAIADTLVLVTTPLAWWIYYLGSGDINMFSIIAAVCKMIKICCVLFPHMSAWIIVLVTAQRTIMVFFPTEAVSICSKKNTVIALVVLLAAITVIDSSCLIFLDGIPFQRSYGPVCFFTNPWDEIGHELDFLIVGIIPGFVIFVANVAVVYTLRRRRGLMAKLRKDCHLADSARRRRKKWRSITRMLLVVGSVFLCTTLPLTVYNIGTIAWHNSMSKDTWDAFVFCHGSKMRLVHGVLYFVFLTNSAVNFLLYTTAGESFRKAFKELPKVLTISVRDPA